MMKTIFLVTSYLLLTTLIGCDAFVRKFTRKPKNEDKPQQELVLAPEEYPAPQMTKEQLYRKYFTYWKLWQDELIQALTSNTNHKKTVDCIEQATKNLSALDVLMDENKTKQLNVYIGQLNDLQERIARDPYGTMASTHRQSAERLKRNILRDFSYQKIRKDLI